MSLETEIREAFERHAGDAQPAGDTWTEIERRIKTSHTRRTFLAGAAAAIAIAAIAVAAPRLGSKNPQPIVPGPVPTAGWQIYGSSAGGYRLLYPGDWRVSENNGVAAFSPNSPDVVRDGKVAFEVAVRVESRAYNDLPTPRPEVTRTTGKLGPLSYIRDERVAEPSYSVSILLDWTNPACPSGAPCPRPTVERRLRFDIFAADDALWKRYHPSAEQMFHTVGPLVRSPAAEPKVTAKLSVQAFALAAGPDAVWALQRPEAPLDPARLVRIDPQTNKAVASIAIGTSPNAVVADADAVWVTNGVTDGLAAPYPQMNSVMRINPRTNKVVATVRVANPQDLALGFGSVWVTAGNESASGTSVHRIDPATNQIIASVPLDGDAGFAHIAVGEAHVWVTTRPGSDQTTVHKIDPNSNRAVPPVILIQAGESVAPIAVGEGSVWVAIPGLETANAIARIDPATGRVVAKIQLPDPAPIGITAITTAEGYVWATGGRGSLWRVDPRVNAPYGDPVVVGDDPPVGASDVIYAFNSLWVPPGVGGIWRIDP